MKILISTLDKALIISLVAGLIVALIFFFVAGIHRVKKNHAVVIEKYGEYYKTLYQGWHFCFPILYRRVGYYNLSTTERSVLIENIKRITIKYKIIDCQKLHYSKLSLQDLINNIRKQYSEITAEILIKEFDKIGLKFISVS